MPTRVWCKTDLLIICLPMLAGRGFVTQRDQNGSEAVYVVSAVQQLRCLVRLSICSSSDLFTLSMHV